MPPSSRLHDKTAILTGVGLGLGEGITRKFVSKGARSPPLRNPCRQRQASRQCC